jgi:hypothetical protein
MSCGVLATAAPGDSVLVVVVLGRGVPGQTLLVELKDTKGKTLEDEDEVTLMTV